MKKIIKSYFPYFLMLPAVIYLTAIIIYPLFFSLNLSLYKWTFGLPYNTHKFVGLQNYLELFTDSLFLTSVRVLLIYAIVALTIETIIGFGVALLLNRDLKGKSLFKTLIIAPLTITPVIVGMMWKMLYHPQYGMVNYFLSFIKLGPIAWLSNIFIALPAVILVDIWQWTPFMIMIFFSGLQSLPKEPYDAAKVDGASSWQMLRYLAIPMLTPVALVAILIRTMDVLRLFDNIYILTFGGPGTATEVTSLYAYRMGFVQSHMGKAAAASYFLLILVVGISFILVKSFYKRIEM